MHYYFRVAEADRTFQGEDEQRNTKGRINQQQKPGINKKTHKNDDCLWQHDQTKRLFDLWSREECLYNVRNQEYLDGKMPL